MKKFIISIVILNSIYTAYGAVNANIFAGYTGTGDLSSQYGSGVELSAGIGYRIRAFIFTMYNTANIPMPEEGEDLYSYAMITCGIQYVYPLDFYKLYWTNSFGAGDAIAYSKDYTITVPDKFIETRENGFVVQYRTGLIYEWSQFITPYIELGYHQAFYERHLSSTTVRGVQVLAGVRFCLFGVNKSISDQY